MESETADFLVSPAGETSIKNASEMLLQRLPTVTGISNLRRNLTIERAVAVWSAAEIRSRSGKKLGEVGTLLVLDRDGYEMASGAVASIYHAEILARSGCIDVVDLCAGAGLDSIAFARKGMSVIAYELNPARAKLLAENVRRLGLSDNIKICNEDATTANIPKVDAAFFDPARRTESRKWSKTATVPPMSFLYDLQSRGLATVLAKLAPAVDRSVGKEFGGELQFLSTNGECKEALLLLGSLKKGTQLSAVKLPSQEEFQSNETCAIRNETSGFIWEPDPAVIRAGLTSALAASLDGWQCDMHNDYFFSDNVGISPFAVCYRVKETITYSTQRLQAALVGVGKVILKQRNFPQTIEEVRSQLKLVGKQEEIVILAGFNRRKFAFIVERLESVTGTP
jgi:hypothetical protein